MRKKIYVKKYRNKIPKERVSDTILEHPVPQLVSEKERKPDEIVSHLVGWQVIQIQVSIDDPHNEFESNKLKGTCVICVSEKLLPRKHAKLIFLSPLIIISHETRRHYLRIQKLFSLTILKKNLFLNFTSTPIYLFLFQNHQRISKIRNRSDTKKIFEPNFVSHTQGVKMLGEKGASSKPRFFESSTWRQKSSYSGCCTI